MLVSNSKKTAVILTSDSLRHKYFAACASQLFDVKFVITEKKKNYYVEQKLESGLVAKHFGEIKSCEERWFPIAPENAMTKWSYTDNINDHDNIKLALECKADVILLFGTSILDNSWLSEFGKRIVNLHLGLSPFYRGSATLFWPFYYDELGCLGTTIHLAVEKVDAGEIIHRIKPDWVSGYDYYDITMSLIKKSIDIFPQTVMDYLNGQLLPFSQEDVLGKLCRKSDFTEDCLSKVLKNFGRGITDSKITETKESLICHC